jgi:hypothetical protein
VVVDVRILGLPSVGHPAGASAAVEEDWHSNVVFVELMDDGHDAILTVYLLLTRIAEKAEVVRVGERGVSCCSMCSS